MCSVTDSSSGLPAVRLQVNVNKPCAVRNKHSELQLVCSLSDWNALQESPSCWDRGCCHCSQHDNCRPTRESAYSNGELRPSPQRQKTITEQSFSAVSFLLKNVGRSSSESTCPKTRPCCSFKNCNYSELNKTKQKTVLELHRLQCMTIVLHKPCVHVYAMPTVWAWSHFHNLD